VSGAEDYFVHESACVDEGARIGAGTRIWHYSHVLPDARIGKNVVVGQNVNIGSGAVIGDGCKIQNNVSVYDNVILEENVFCGPSMVFTNVLTPRAHVSRKSEYVRTTVRRGATLGANCTVVCGNEIGAYAMIGAGAVVTKSVPAYALFVGNPAKQLGWVCNCGERLDFEAGAAKCGRCNRSYAQRSETEIEEIDG
jgi:UDP-2-acetamido-3-amino-2,3-dideoxy-glucuronate N-acetyltransferase